MDLVRKRLRIAQGRGNLEILQPLIDELGLDRCQTCTVGSGALG